jgi:hypothetical protein
VAAYGFDETDDVWVLDASGAGNDGLVEGATRIAEGRFGRALAFDGIDDWVTVEDADSLDLTDDLTLEAWVYPTSSLSGWHTVLFKEQPWNATYYLYANTWDDQPVTAINPTSDFGGLQRLYGGTKLAANTWTHLAATYDGNWQRLYVNGNEVANRAQSGSIRQSGGVLRMGGNDIWGEFFQGYLDEVRIYNRALTAEEILADMETPVVDDGTAEPGLVETGEVQIDHQWQRVAFTRSFTDPVVVARSLSHNGDDPAVVRIRNVDAKGFEIRVQEWDYLDDIHTLETVGYLAMERGSHILDDGTRVEAGRFEADNTSSYKTVTLEQAFQQKPVVLSAITSFNEDDAVATRMRNISTTSFQFQMQEQEANSKAHLMETIDYVAWEPSAGTVDGVAFEVNQTGNVVKHNPYGISFQELFADEPVFLADMQTRDGGDSSNVRWENKDLYGVSVCIDEEQSKDTEINHTTEVVGYMVFSTLD